MSRTRRSTVGRIHDRHTFSELRNGSRGRSGPLTVSFVRASSSSDRGPEVRVAYGIGRLVGPATTRNRVRRRLRAAVHDDAGVMRPGAYLVTAGPQAVHLGFSELRALLKSAVRRATEHHAESEI